MRFLVLILKNLSRNRVRTILTSLGTVVLVLVVTLIWSVLSFLDEATSDKQSDFKVVITEKWQIPSQMPFAYAQTLEEGAAQEPGDIRPMDSMTWQFFGGTIDPGKRTRENSLFAIAIEPKKLLTMMDELDRLEKESPSTYREFKKSVDALSANRQGIILGKDRLKQINKQVGERFRLYGLNYKDIELEFEIVGMFPSGRYDNSAAFDREYLRNALDVYPQTHGGTPHPQNGKSLNLVWLRVPDEASFQKISEQIINSPRFQSPAVKVETASSGIATFLEAYRDLIWGMRWMLAPSILVTLSLVISNAISISVRERRMEFAVLKVLGFQPYQILLLVLGEALLVGALSGLISASLTYTVVNIVYGGLKFPIAFFGAFRIPISALWWGVGIGTGTALVGSLVPAWSACTVKVSDVFAKVT